MNLLTVALTAPLGSDLAVPYGRLFNPAGDGYRVFTQDAFNKTVLAFLK